MKFRAKVWLEKLKSATDSYKQMKPFIENRENSTRSSNIPVS